MAESRPEFLIWSFIVFLKFRYIANDSHFYLNSNEFQQNLKQSRYLNWLHEFDVDCWCKQWTWIPNGKWIHFSMISANFILQNVNERRLYWILMESSLVDWNERKQNQSKYQKSKIKQEVLLIETWSASSTTSSFSFESDPIYIQRLRHKTISIES